MNLDCRKKLSSSRAIIGDRWRGLEVRIDRANLIVDAARVMNSFGTSQALVEIEYVDEVGTGCDCTPCSCVKAAKRMVRSLQTTVLCWPDLFCSPAEYRYPMFSAFSDYVFAGEPCSPRRLMRGRVVLVRCRSPDGPCREE